MDSARNQGVIKISFDTYFGNIWNSLHHNKFNANVVTKGSLFEQVV